MRKSRQCLFFLAFCCGMLSTMAAEKSANNKGVDMEGGTRGVVGEAPAGWLVSPAEALAYQGPQGFNEAPMLRAKSLMPAIDIIQPHPNADTKVQAPFAIEVQFKSLADAEIVPSTFRVLYGALKIDITGRVTKYVKVSEQGFNLENAHIPVGKHRLILQIQDDKQRMAERELRFEVE